MADSNPHPEYYANVPVSSPTVVPEAEDILMNGFAWSTTFGLMIALGTDGEVAVDELGKLREDLNAVDLSRQGVRRG